MPPLYYLIDQVLRRLRRTQGHVSDLVIQVLVGKLSNIYCRHIYVQTSAKKKQLEISSKGYLPPETR